MDNLTKQNEQGSTLSGALLIAGTSIGAGMLGIPLITGLAGFVPCMLANAFCWLFMMLTGLLFLEVTLWMEDGSNVLSMTQRFLGPAGKVIGGALFTFLYYCLLTAYFSGGAPLFLFVLNESMQLSLSTEAGYLLFFTCFFIVLFLGAKITDRVNFLLVGGMTLAYLIVIALGSCDVDTQLLKTSNWPVSIMAFPVLFSAYGYHNVIPSISTYLGRNTQNLRRAIIIGTTIPFIVYSVWQWMIIGSVPKETLLETLQAGLPVTSALKASTNYAWIIPIGQYFSFFALVTSVLGVSLSMIDFFADGLKVQRTGMSRALLCLVVFVPPLLFSWNNPNMFLLALEYAGGFGEAILNGLIPISMVWIGRYRMNLSSETKLFGGKPLLLLLGILTLSIVAIETYLVIAGKPH